MLHRRWFPDRIDGTKVVLKRHTRDNLADFLRWYQDPEVSRLTRYQDSPMRPDEIERFFMMRALGPDTLAMGIHVRDTGRLVGSCAFSQLDADNGSVLFHITIGEHDAWGRGYGGEATTLMVDHAFTSLGSAPRVAVRVRLQRAGDPVLRAGRLRERGSRPRGHLARRPLVGRDPHERARTRVASGTLGGPRDRGREGSRAGAAGGRRGYGRAGAGGEPQARPGSVTASTGPAADAARAAFRDRSEAKGHVVDNAREAVVGLDAAFASGALRKTPALGAMLADLSVALDQDEGQRLGGQERRGRAVHPAGDQPRAGQRLTDESRGEPKVPGGRPVACPARAGVSPGRNRADGGRGPG